MPKNIWPRALVLPLTAAALMVTSACNDFLKVKNPGAIEEPEINNPAYITLLVNGVSPLEARRNNDFAFVFQDAVLLPWRLALRSWAADGTAGQQASEPGTASW